MTNTAHNFKLKPWPKKNIGPDESLLLQQICNEFGDFKYIKNEEKRNKSGKRKVAIIVTI